MRTAFASALTGSGLWQRAMRSSALTMGGFATSQALRLLSNLVLTRLLFPEAFGMMAIVAMVSSGLMMFSDVGVTPAIMQSKRGDDPAFLDTAWSIQVARGITLFLIGCAAGVPMAWFYNQPMFMAMMPVSALALLLAGFNPTRLDTANRHLALGRVTAIDIAAQILSLGVAIALARLTGSVWSLVISGVVSAALVLAFYTWLLPGHRNRLAWERSAAHELIHFGKWIFLSTVVGFAFHQGDKLVLGKALPLDTFGIYNIGYFLASFPMLLGGLVVRRVLIPVYRETPPAESRENFLKLRRMRFIVTATLMALLAAVALLGVWLVGLLYDPRYHLAGPVVALLALMQTPFVIVLTYDQAALAAGDSRRFFVLQSARAALMIGGLLIGVQMAGLLGAILGQGAALLLAYPVVVWLARHQKAWDPLHDLVFGLCAIVIAALTIWRDGAYILELAAPVTG
ncbi:oligosaccharide flippase family protein [Litorisediminicola beolgyonensis]|uniref:Oligosaccharide flippase family protein n=1 Tax=Litorisediminicola beolgyonensis TaxID=1173614 RepID=A0ABW3ZGH7_9RHOB